MAKKGNPTYRNGYKFVPAPPGHPRANGRGYIAEHILVMEKKLDRPVLRGEVVHHINGVKDDNRPENLQLFTSGSEHLQHHRDQRRGAIKMALMSITDQNWLDAWATGWYYEWRRFFESQGYGVWTARESAKILSSAHYRLFRLPNKKQIPTSDFLAFVGSKVEIWEKPGQGV